MIFFPATPFHIFRRSRGRRSWPRSYICMYVLCIYIFIYVCIYLCCFGFCFYPATPFHLYRRSRWRRSWPRSAPWSAASILSLYICIYIYTYICVYIYICICICTYIFSSSYPSSQAESLATFVTKICAVIGGIYTVVGLLDSVMYHSLQKSSWIWSLETATISFFRLPLSRVPRSRVIWIRCIDGIFTVSIPWWDSSTPSCTTRCRSQAESKLNQFERL